jgi:hypothetical protein
MQLQTRQLQAPLFQVVQIKALDNGIGQQNQRPVVGAPPIVVQQYVNHDAALFKVQKSDFAAELCHILVLVDNIFSLEGYRA